MSEQGARVRFPPPLVFLILLLVGVGLRYLKPLGSGIAPLSYVGVALMVGSIAIGLWARGWFKRTGQDPAPWKPSPELIVQGPYKFTRNPLYVTMFTIQVGFGLAFDNYWIVLLAPLGLAIVHFTAVVPEETYLEEKFGDSYRDFKKSVRRYL